MIASILRILIATAAWASLPHPSIAAPDYAQLDGALAEVYISGADEHNGNTLETTRGTGFFIDPRGMLITALHVRENLPVGVHPESMTYSVRPRAYPGVVMRAAPMSTDLVNDLLVLFVETDGYPNIRALRRTTVDEAALKVGSQTYLMGYATPGSYSAFEGPIASLTPRVDPPAPRLQLGVTLLPGQSGAPVLTDDGAVVAVAIQSLDGAPNVSLATLVSLVGVSPWGKGIFPPKSAVDVAASPTLVLTSSTPVEPRRRLRKISWANMECQPEETHVIDVRRSDGWKIVPTSINVMTTAFSGDLVGSRMPVIESTSPESFRVSAKLMNEGACTTIDVPAGGSTQKQDVSDTPAKLIATASYLERPADGPTATASYAVLPQANATLDLSRFNADTKVSMLLKQGLSEAVDLKSLQAAQRKKTTKLDSSEVLKAVIQRDRMIQSRTR
jgi:hypothetical protein